MSARGKPLQLQCFPTISNSPQLPTFCFGSRRSQVQILSPRSLDSRIQVARRKGGPHACVGPFVVFTITDAGITPGRGRTQNAYSGLGVNVIRRFCARPSGVLLSATGCDSPYPAEVSEPAGTLFEIRYLITARARASERL